LKRENWVVARHALGLHEHGEDVIRCIIGSADGTGFLGVSDAGRRLWSVEEFSADLRSVKRVSHSTLRGYHSALRAFTSYISNPDYGWDRVCEEFFDSHPAQVFFAWNTAPHVQEYDGRPAKRPYMREELQALLDHADAEVERVSNAGTKGWQAAYRDATMMKVAYGLRTAVQRVAAPADRRLRGNPHAREFGKFGVCKVR